MHGGRTETQGECDLLQYEEAEFGNSLDISERNTFCPNSVVDVSMSRTLRRLRGIILYRSKAAVLSRSLEAEQEREQCVLFARESTIRTLSSPWHLHCSNL